MSESEEQARSPSLGWVGLISAAVLSFSTCCPFTWLPALFLSLVFLIKLKGFYKVLVIVILLISLVRALATVEVYYYYFVHPLDPSQSPIKGFAQFVPYGAHGEPGFFEAQIRSRNQHAMEELRRLSMGDQELTEDVLQGTKDPYAKAPYRLKDASPVVKIYSVGPDQLDQKGEIAYDPTNGMVSIGDIWVEGD